MPKLDHVQQKKLTPADELRELLQNLEERQVTLKEMTASQALAFLRHLDQLEARFSELEAAGLDLAPEQGRFQAIQMRLHSHPARLLKALGGVTVLRAHRPSPPPPHERWWWYVDELTAAQRRHWLRQVGMVAAGVIFLIGGVLLLFKTVLAPSTEVIARVEAEDKAWTAIDQGDYQQALAQLDLGLAKVPGDPDLLLFKGVVQERLGHQPAAAEILAQLQAGQNDPLKFYLARGQLLFRMAQFDQAEQEVGAALKLDENTARAWLLLGQILEAQNKRDEALSAYQKAGELAETSNESEVVVMARLAVGRLLAAP